MPLIYVTGPTGAGKTTIRNLLRSQGYEAHDTDEEGFTIYANRHTVEPIHYPEDPAERTETWHA